MLFCFNRSSFKLTVHHITQKYFLNCVFRVDIVFIFVETKKEKYESRK